MPVPRLIFLGPLESAAALVQSPGSAGSAPALLHEGAPLSSGQALPLERRRSPWRQGGATERVLVGSHPSRADVLLSGAGIFPEHVRIYVPRGGGGPPDLLAIEPRSTRVNGRPVEPREWTALRAGDILELGPWRFRYEESSP